MRKNVASQVISFQAVAAADGSAVTTGTPVVYYTIDGGTQGTGAGTKTHEGNGQWSYVPAQAETNGNQVAFTFTLTNAISQTVNVYPVSFDPTDADDLGLTNLTNHTPQTGDSFARLGVPAGGDIAEDIVELNTLVDTRCSSIRMATLTDWINGGRLDLIIDAINAKTTNLPADPATLANQSSLLSRLTSARGGYLDNLAIGGNVASQSSVDSITNSVRNQLVIPQEYQLPASGSERFKLTVLIYALDSSGLEDPDSNAVTVAVENAAGTSRSGNLYNAVSAGSATTSMTRIGTGHYELFYEIDAADAEEQLNWLISYAEGTLPQKGAGQTTVVAIASGGGFNSSDRSMATTVFNDLADGGRLDVIWDATLLDTGTTIPALITARTLIASAYFISGSDTVTLATSQAFNNTGQTANLPANVQAWTGLVITSGANMIELDGADYRWTTQSLEQGPAGGGGSGDIASILGTSITEASAGRLAASFTKFLDVATPTKTINDIGVAGSGLSQQDVRDAGLLAPTAGTPAAGSTDKELDTILSKLTKPTKIYVNPVRPNHLEITRGDAYDGISWPKLSWDAGKDIDGKNFTLTIRDKDDTKDDSPLMRVTGIGVGQMAEPIVKSSDTINLPISADPTDLKFDVEVNNDADSDQTIAKGTVTVSEDQT